MTSASQIAANRQNAAASAGPRTAAGLEASKHNATRHGLTGKQVVVNDEDPAEYDAFRSSMLHDLGPANEVEAVLAEEIVQSHWRLQRARRMEQQLLAKYDDLDCITDPEASKAWDRLQRYMTRIERSFHTAYSALTKLQRSREDSVAFNQTLMARAGSSPNGFVSQDQADPYTDVPANFSEDLFSAGPRQAAA